MLSSIVLGALLVVANILGSSMAYPQVRRLMRTGEVAGVSGVWAAVSTMMNLWWLVYGLANQLWGLVPVSLIAVVLYGLMTVVWVRRRPGQGGDSVRQIAIGVGLGLGPLPFLLVGGWVGAGLAIGLGYTAQLLPALVASYRHTDLSGIAAGTWIMAFGEAVVWGIYGVWVSDVALLVGGVGGLVISALVLARLSSTGHRPFAFGRVPAVA